MLVAIIIIIIADESNTVVLGDVCTVAMCMVYPVAVGDVDRVTLHFNTGYFDWIPRAA